MPPRNTTRQGTAVKKNYQIDRCCRDGADRAGVGDCGVGRAGCRCAGRSARDGCGHRAAGDGRDDGRRRVRGVRAEGQASTRPQRGAARDRERGSVTLGGRRVPVRRPRMRAADGSGEVPLAFYELFSSTEVLGRMAMGRMLAGLSARRYPTGLEPVGGG